MSRPGVGITLQPEERFLELVQPLAADCADYVEVAPETLWCLDAGGSLQPNAYHRAIHRFAAEQAKPVVAHGVGLSLGSADLEDEARLARWLRRIRGDHEVFDFLWYTDHLGVTTLDGRALALPLALPMTDTAVDLVAARLRRLQQVVPEVGFENSVFYFLLGEWLDEPAFIRRILRRAGAHLLLDLHNVYTMAVNHGRDPRAYLALTDLDRVIEIHLSGGQRSDPAWLPGGESVRLDSHDDAVPEPVWELYEDCVGRCSALRGVTLERMEGTVDEADVPVLRDELARAREGVRRVAS